MYFVKTPQIAQSLLKNVVWNLPNDSNSIYLTFDDGPTKEVTGKTLEILNHFGIKATFFCLGQQVEKYPELYQKIISEGHAIGNHSYSHLKGWLTANQNYFIDIQKGESLIKSNLFRPPYGKITRGQSRELSKKYKIIMWDVLSGDFSPKNSVENVISNVLDNTENGSIIVLHDNDKCGSKMLLALPTIIQQLQAKGFTFDAISPHS